MAKKKLPHPRFYPHRLIRFLDLQGGQYGALDLVAVSGDAVELQLGGDFVRFTRKQAEGLLDGLQAFLALYGHEDHRSHERETPAEEQAERERREEERERRDGVVETVAEEVLEHEPRPRPRTQAKPPLAPLAKRKRPGSREPSVEG